MPFSPDDDCHADTDDAAFADDAAAMFVITIFFTLTLLPRRHDDAAIARCCCWRYRGAADAHDISCRHYDAVISLMPPLLFFILAFAITASPLLSLLFRYFHYAIFRDAATQPPFSMF